MSVPKKIMEAPTRLAWQPDSWQQRDAKHQPAYPDDAALNNALVELQQLPGLVSWGETERLKTQLAEAARGERFVLQGGDCAESFADCTGELIGNKLKIMLQMSLVLVHGLNKPIVRVGRIAGQYAKPRSTATETRGDTTLPSYLGDLVNGHEFIESVRIPDPQRLLTGYNRSALTLNHIRSLVGGGLADLHHAEHWNLEFARHSTLAAEYGRIVDTITDSLRFMETIAGRAPNASHRVDFFTCHEGLLLPYEQAQTRYMAAADRWYNAATHFPWIGKRTAALDGAHVEYFRGIGNPIGVKIGDSTSPDQLLRLMDGLDPDHEPGRLTLIHRFGASKIRDCLPPLLNAVNAVGRRPLWICDPMHGNTEKTRNGIKTRRFENILSELESAFAVHKANDSHLGGVHFEMTGENVTECTGGACGVTDDDLDRAYKSQVDPRLNYEQALEMAMRIVATGPSS